MKNLGCLIAGSRLAAGLFAWLLWPGILAAQPDGLKLNGIFTENMVLQRDADVPVYGTAGEDEKVSVEFNGQKAETIAKDGKWKVNLKAVKILHYQVHSLCLRKIRSGSAKSILALG